MALGFRSKELKENGKKVPTTPRPPRGRPRAVARCDRQGAPRFLRGLPSASLSYPCCLPSCSPGCRRVQPAPSSGPLRRRPDVPFTAASAPKGHREGGGAKGLSQRPLLLPLHSPQFPGFSGCFGDQTEAVPSVMKVPAYTLLESRSQRKEEKNSNM